MAGSGAVLCAGSAHLEDLVSALRSGEGAFCVALGEVCSSSPAHIGLNINFGGRTAASFSVRDHAAESK
jgi:hypothetical protein